MQDDLINVYESQNLMEAKLVSDWLKAEEIQYFIENVASPFDGLLTADQVKIIRVLPDAADRARQIVADFESQQVTT